VVLEYWPEPSAIVAHTGIAPQHSRATRLAQLMRKPGIISHFKIFKATFEAFAYGATGIEANL
jgi:hypothetical protein